MRKKSIKNRAFRITAMLLAICAMAPLFAPVSLASYTPPYTTLRIGLFYGSTELPSANLQNVSGTGSGFDFGYFDSRRNFVPIGAWTDETRISMMMDRNMFWQAGAGSGAGEYQEGVDSSIVVGCYHVQLNSGYGTFEEAKAEADKYDSAFVRYQSERFLVLIGQYISRAAAENGMAELGIRGTAINSGTQYTITVARTGTSRILFEFDMGTSYQLGVRPRPIDSRSPETWFQNYKYTGGFQYARLDGAFLTVINFVSVEDYIKGVVPNEMSSSWPIEALKAQAVCARTYAYSSLGRHSAAGFDLCTTEHCQVYRGRERANNRTDQAVDETEGMLVTYDGELTQTFYAASNGGASESAENVWTQAFPYLQGVIDPYEAYVASRVANYYWTITYTPAEITQRLQDRGYGCSTIVSMVVSRFSPTGNVVEVTMTDSNGRRFVFAKRAQLASALGVPLQHFTIGNQNWEPENIFVNDPAISIGSPGQVFTVGGDGTTVVVDGSTLYAIDGSGSVVAVEGESGADGSVTNLIDGVFTIRGAGRGHSVGMSQWGAYSMAFYFDKTYEDIIKFYYTGVEITSAGA